MLSAETLKSLFFGIGSRLYGIHISASLTRHRILLTRFGGKVRDNDIDLLTEHKWEQETALRFSWLIYCLRHTSDLGSSFLAFSLVVLSL
jgi:hypothetical protein